MRCAPLAIATKLSRRTGGTKVGVAMDCTDYVRVFVMMMHAFLYMRYWFHPQRDIKRFHIYMYVYFYVSVGR